MNSGYLREALPPAFFVITQHLSYFRLRYTIIRPPVPTSFADAAFRNVEHFLQYSGYNSRIYIGDLTLTGAHTYKDVYSLFSSSIY